MDSDEEDNKRNPLELLRVYIVEPPSFVRMDFLLDVFMGKTTWKNFDLDPIPGSSGRRGFIPQSHGQ
jgi:hypothetical protein